MSTWTSTWPSVWGGEDAITSPPAWTAAWPTVWGGDIPGVVAYRFAVTEQAAATVRDATSTAAVTDQATVTVREG